MKAELGLEGVRRSGLRGGFSSAEAAGGVQRSRARNKKAGEGDHVEGCVSPPSDVTPPQKKMEGRGRRNVLL